jgi:tRNA 2-thiouridine synthesizing protein E
MSDLDKPPATMDEVMHPTHAGESDANFPDAPPGWKKADAEFIAKQEGVTLTPDHWQAIGALQSYFSSHRDLRVSPRELHDALDEKFHSKGGLKFLYELLPGGPIAQGCRLAGIQPPAGTTDTGFGSVV